MLDIKNWITNLPKQYRTHQNADLPLDQYLAYYSSEFENIRIGCSFSPDLIDQIYKVENGIQNVTVEQKLEILKILIHEYGMQDIRLGIKWSKVVTAHGKLDFSSYHPYLEYCLSHKVAVCLNIGPIKTFGWPEEYVPNHILDSIKDSDRTVDLSSKIAKYALEYLDILLSHIKKTYTKKQLQYLTIIQPENEAFNVFGKQEFVLTPDYLYEVIKKIVTVFPDKKILINSSETHNLPEITQIIKQSKTQNEISVDQFIVGINYYYNLPYFLKIPKLGPVDNITIANIFQRRTHEYNKRNAKKLGYAIEVTEAQFEQWGSAYLSPGNSHHEAKYLLARIAENILIKDIGGVIRLWGFERYAKKQLDNTLTQDHIRNIELIKRINKK